MNNIQTTWQPSYTPPVPAKRVRKDYPDFDPSWLPAGFRAERLRTTSLMYAIYGLDGWVTINVRHRIFAPGHGGAIAALVPPEFKGRKYTGAHWLERLVRDACGWLQQTMTAHPVACST